MLGGAAEEIVRMLDHVLIEGRAGGHQHRGRGALAAARPSRALPARCDGARVAGHHHGVERADVDPQLERVRGHYRADLAVAQLALDLAALARQVAAAVAAHRLAGDGAAVAGILKIGYENLGRQPVIREYQRLQAALDELQRHPPALPDVAAADAELAVDHRRVIEDEVFFAARSAVPLHQLERLAGQRLGQLARIGDGRRAADQPRPRPVKLRDAPQPPQQVRQVAAVNPAVIVQLVDHQVAQILEIPRPPRVVRQDARVQHVGIGQHDVGPLPYGLAGVLRGVAIVGEGADPGTHPVHRGLKFVQLVFGQRLCGEQVHGAGAVVGQQRVQHRQVVAQGLAARGRGHDHHVPVGLQVVERFGLVTVEARDAAPLERSAKALVDGVRHIGESAFDRRLVVDGAYRRIRLLVGGAKGGHHAFERSLRRDREFLREFRKSEGQVHAIFRLFFATL